MSNENNNDENRMWKDAPAALCEFVGIDPARRLAQVERERDEAKEHLRAANKGAEINAHINNSLAAKLADAKRERDEAREQLDIVTAQRDAWALKCNELRARYNELPEVEVTK